MVPHRMHASREEITAALRQAFGAGHQRLITTARETLRDSGCHPLADPRRIAIGLRKQVRERTDMLERASVDGNVISFRYPGPDEREWGLNMFLGLSVSRLGDLQIAADRADVICFAGYLALPDLFETAHAFELQRYLPQWFIASHCHMRAVGNGSGVLRLVSSR
jgi:hypothetical protein